DVPEVDQLLNQANEETDTAKRKALFNQAERKIVDDAPWLFITHSKHQVGMRNRVKDFQINPTYIYYCNDVSLGSDPPPLTPPPCEGEGRRATAAPSPSHGGGGRGVGGNVAYLHPSPSRPHGAGAAGRRDRGVPGAAVDPRRSGDRAGRRQGQRG